MFYALMQRMACLARLCILRLDVHMLQCKPL